jgi:hypothetical protein
MHRPHSNAVKALNTNMERWDGSEFATKLIEGETLWKPKNTKLNDIFHTNLLLSLNVMPNEIFNW